MTKLNRKSSRRWKPLEEFAEDLRANPTDAETALLRLLAEGKLADRFVFQSPYHGKYILDFYDPDCDLAVELYGEIHARKWCKEKDYKRTRFLEENGTTVLSFWNDKIEKRPFMVLAVIWNQLRVLGYEGKIPRLKAAKPKRLHVPVGSRGTLRNPRSSTRLV